jgi:hypothetical protein
MRFLIAALCRVEKSKITWISRELNHLPVPLQVGQIIFLSPPQLEQGLPDTFPVPLQTGQLIVLNP